MVAKVLTPLAVKAARPKRNGDGELVRNEIPDRGCSGVYLVVQPSGVKTWALRYRFKGMPKKLTLGAVADHEIPGGDALTLAGARKAAADARHKVDQGVDPATQKQQAKAASAKLAALRDIDSVEVLAELFIEHHAKRRTRERTARQTESVLRRLVLPAWRGRTVHDVRRRDVIALVESIAADRGPQMANKALAVLGKFFNWLVGRDVVVTSPCQGVERPGRSIPRERTLDDGEIVALWQACGHEGVFGLLVRMLLLIGARRTEVSGMRWDELDESGRLWRLPGERVKNAIPHAVPLSQQAWAIVAAQPTFAGCGFVFTADGRRPITGFSHLKDRLDRRMKPPAAWRLHDLRRSCASGLQRLDVPGPVIERALNHVSGAYRGVAGIYQRDPLTEHVRAGLQRWADHVEQLVTGEPATVLPMHGRRRQ